MIPGNHLRCRVRATRRRAPPPCHEASRVLQCPARKNIARPGTDTRRARARARLRPQATDQARAGTCHIGGPPWAHCARCSTKPAVESTPPHGDACGTSNNVSLRGGEAGERREQTNWGGEERALWVAGSKGVAQPGPLVATHTHTYTGNHWAPKAPATPCMRAKPPANRNSWKRRQAAPQQHARASPRCGAMHHAPCNQAGTGPHQTQDTVRSCKPSKLQFPSYAH